MTQIIKNVFVSHHHKDDASVDGISELVKGKGYSFRNSSIRIKAKNKERVEKNLVSDLAIKRLLRMKMKWAGQVIVIIGNETYTRKWVDWEIQVAKSLGKPIIGVYENGLSGDVEIPENLKKYSSSIVGWRSESIIGALEGRGEFQNTDGTTRVKEIGGSLVC
jgi:hypothetical protein